MIDNEARVGAGMLNMRERMTTVGGKLTVHSRERNRRSDQVVRDSPRQLAHQLLVAEGTR